MRSYETDDALQWRRVCGGFGLRLGLCRLGARFSCLRTRRGRGRLFISGLSTSFGFCHLGKGLCLRGLHARLRSLHARLRSLHTRLGSISLSGLGTGHGLYHLGARLGLRGLRTRLRGLRTRLRGLGTRLGRFFLSGLSTRIGLCHLNTRFGTGLGLRGLRTSLGLRGLSERRRHSSAEPVSRARHAPFVLVRRITLHVAPTKVPEGAVPH